MTDTLPPLTMRQKQLAACVRQGKLLSFTILDEGPIDGYLAGWDDDTYLVLFPYFDRDEKENLIDQLLIPKGNILWIKMAQERTFRDEPRWDEMEPIVKPFLNFLNKHYPAKSE